MIQAIISQLPGLLIGVILGVFGKYYGDKLTDQRKKSEAKSSIREKFDACRKQMPELFEEMTADLKQTPLKSEFVLVHVNRVYGGFPERPFNYSMNDERHDETYKDGKTNTLVHSHLLDKVKILESAGFVIEITRNSVPYFRMSDEFKEMLQN